MWANGKSQKDSARNLILDTDPSKHYYHAGYDNNLLIWLDSSDSRKVIGDNQKFDNWKSLSSSNLIFTNSGSSSTLKDSYLSEYSIVEISPNSFFEIKDFQLIQKGSILFVFDKALINQPITLIDSLDLSNYLRIKF